MKKFKISLLLLLFAPGSFLFACPVCERNQPQLLKGITHGAGPESRFDYLIIGFIAVIVVVTLFYSIKWLIRPGEQSPDHIKRLVLNENWR